MGIERENEPPDLGGAEPSVEPERSNLPWAWLALAAAIAAGIALAAIAWPYRDRFFHVELVPVGSVPSPDAAGRAGLDFAPVTTSPLSQDAVPVAPGESIQDHVDRHPEGTAFLLEAGLHLEQSVEPKRGNTFTGEGGAVLDGNGTAVYAFKGSARDITIQGLVIENYVAEPRDGVVAAEPGGGGWTIVGNEVRYNQGSGVQVGSEWVVADNFIHHNDQYGINGSGRDILIEGNELSHNATCECNLHAEGGTKFVYTRGLVVRGNYVHDNFGPGLWTDINNIDTLFEANRVVDNLGPGIKVEISYDTMVRENIVERNGVGETGLVRGAGVLVNTSSGVTVEDNVVAGNKSGVVGTHQDRSGTPSEPDHGEWAVQQLWVHDNLIVMAQGQTGLVSNTDHPVFSEEWSNRFEANTYWIEPGTVQFAWGGETLDWEGWQGAGHDRQGRTETLAVPDDS